MRCRQRNVHRCSSCDSTQLHTPSNVSLGLFPLLSPGSLDALLPQAEPQPCTANACALEIQAFGIVGVGRVRDLGCSLLYQVLREAGASEIAVQGSGLRVLGSRAQGPGFGGEGDTFFKGSFGAQEEGKAA